MLVIKGRACRSEMIKILEVTRIRGLVVDWELVDWEESRLPHTEKAVPDCLWPVILSNGCGVASPTTTISSISVASEAVVKTEHQS